MSTLEILSSNENLHRFESAECLNAMTISDDNADPASLVSDPAWLTKDYIEHCLRNHYEDKKLRVLKAQAAPAFGNGENYGGVLTRANAEFKRSNGTIIKGQYIIKTSYEANEFARNTMAPYDIFNREMAIYEKVLPKLKQLLHEINDPEQIFAETMAVDTKRSALVFEDLSARGFVMPNRVDGLDVSLTKLILRKLAKMHAASAVLNEREGGSLECYDKGFYNRYTDNYAPCFVGLLEACSRMLSQCDEYKRYGKKLAELGKIHMELGRRVFEASKGHLNVLAHGDLWTNNVLVKYNADRSDHPEDVIIIDFQYVVWSSPAIDLFYLFNTSLKEDMHINRQDELIQYYYQTFAETLLKMSYKAKIPSLHKFHLQLDEKSYYAFTSTCIVQPVQRNVETEDADFDALMQKNERGIRFKNTVYTNPYCQRIIKHMLPVYERKGLLELDQ